MKFALVLSCWLGLACARAGSSTIDSSSTVFIIVMENHNWSTIKGSVSAPYINGTLLPMASYCDQYYNPAGIHPSEPNYLWLEAGTGFGITNDALPAINHQSTTSHLVTLLKNAGISWKTYQENISGNTCPITDSYPYAAKHNPFVFFDDVVGAYCTAAVRPFSELATDLANNSVAHYNFITPNLINDMHDGTITQGDSWLSQNVPLILNCAAFKNNGLLLITWDEGASSSDGPIGLIALSPLAKGGGFHSAVRHTHSSTLRTVQRIFGVGPFLGDAASALDLSELFQTGAIPNGDQLVVYQGVARAFDGSFAVSWFCQSGVTYRVQWKNTIGATAWQNITPDFTGNGGLLSWTDDGSQTGGVSTTQRFYRIVVP